MIRMFKLIAINEKTKRTYVLNTSPLSHKEAVTMMGKFTPHRHVRIQLQEVQQ